MRTLEMHAVVHCAALSVALIGAGCAECERPSDCSDGFLCADGRCTDPASLRPDGGQRLDVGHVPQPRASVYVTERGANGTAQEPVPLAGALIVAHDPDGLTVGIAYTDAEGFASIEVPSDGMVSALAPEDRQQVLGTYAGIQSDMVLRFGDGQPCTDFRGEAIPTFDASAYPEGAFEVGLSGSPGVQRVPADELVRLRPFVVSRSCDGSDDGSRFFATISDANNTRVAYAISDRFSIAEGTTGVMEVPLTPWRTDSATRTLDLRNIPVESPNARFSVQAERRGFLTELGAGFSTLPGDAQITVVHPPWPHDPLVAVLSLRGPDRDYREFRTLDETFGTWDAGDVAAPPAVTYDVTEPARPKLEWTFDTETPPYSVLRAQLVWRDQNGQTHLWRVSAPATEEGTVRVPYVTAPGYSWVQRPTNNSTYPSDLRAELRAVDDPDHPSYVDVLAGPPGLEMRAAAWTLKISP